MTVSQETLQAGLSKTLDGTDFESLGKKYEGKVRDCYTADGKRYIVVTDRISAFDRVLGTLPYKGQVLNVRGRLIPLVPLGRLFNLTGPVNPCDAMVVIAQCEGRSMGLIVDELIVQQQVVIKSLGQRFEHVKGIAGAAILGDGKVGLILVPDGAGKGRDARDDDGAEQHEGHQAVHPSHSQTEKLKIEKRMRRALL